MKTFILFLLVICSGSVFGQNVDELMNEAVIHLKKNHFDLAANFAEKAWEKEPRKFTSYVLSVSYHCLQRHDKAAYYSGIALNDNQIKKDVKFTPLQLSDLRSIWDYYVGLKELKNAEIARQLYGNYPRKHVIYTSLHFCASVGTAVQQEVLRQWNDPTWNSFVDSLKTAGVSDSVIVQLHDCRKLDLIGRFSENPVELYADISWNDSTDVMLREGDDEVPENVFLRSKRYTETDYPELFQKPGFLYHSMIVLYQNYPTTGLDPENHFVIRYGLTPKNIEAFYSEFFTEVIDRKDDLDTLLKEYE